MHLIVSGLAGAKVSASCPFAVLGRGGWYAQNTLTVVIPCTSVCMTANVYSNVPE